jgi:hypothetical protein
MSAIKISGIASMEKIKTWFINSYWSVRNCIAFRQDNYQDNIDRCAFFEELNLGWYQMYIYPYDDLYLPTISEERRTRLNQQPYTFYVSQEDYDALLDAINNPPELSPSLLELFQRKLPWD